MGCDSVNRGVAYGNVMILLHQADTTLVSLDARTGEVKWWVKNGYPSKGETGTMAPMVAGDKVLIGVSGGEFGIQGHITAYNLSDGSIAWRGYSQGPDEMMLVDPAQKTHLGEPIGAGHSAIGRAPCGS